MALNSIFVASMISASCEFGNGNGNGNSNGFDKKQLSLIDNETKQVVEGVKWYQKTSYSEDLVFDANQDNEKHI
ncbi:hypothetical protein HYE17_04580 [Mycoplasmopsis bovis]|nr:hypothetical protein [Mycoplasmopsis bovis]TQF42641.1 hypothetical protein A9K73_02620 [Mycoplasmopsis bovis]TQF45724.1 hypothetical protein A9Z44_02220 [Mycoplasmopsis bovis]TQF46751.1 hypothetical protein A9300_01470 [Mycoplasmopsis bovis]WHL54495.1 hypothetical protein HYE17_04580 [Mycoplasmopsis bovis]WNW00541.1 hypothetical protein RSD73_02010 [Mycoplasmopsis bovis]